MLWPLSVVLVANTNGRLAIPALAGLLVSNISLESRLNGLTRRCDTFVPFLVLFVCLLPDFLHPAVTKGNSVQLRCCNVSTKLSCHRETARCSASSTKFYYSLSEVKSY